MNVGKTLFAQVMEACLAANQAKLFHMGLKAPPARSTLSDALNQRDWRTHHALAQRLNARARWLYAQESVLDLDASVHALDATTIDLCLSLFEWAPFRSTKAAIKLHTLLDLRGAIPAFIHISDGKLHDVNVLDILPVEAGAFPAACARRCREVPADGRAQPCGVRRLRWSPDLIAMIVVLGPGQNAILGRSRMKHIEALIEDGGEITQPPGHLYVGRRPLSDFCRIIWAPRRFVWNPTFTMGGRSRARWACGRAASEPVHMSTGHSRRELNRERWS